MGLELERERSERLRARYALAPRGQIEIKARGRMETYLLEERIA